MIKRDLVLEGFGVRLERLAEKHLEELMQRCHDERLWQTTFSDSPFAQKQSARDWMQQAHDDPSCFTFAIVDTGSGAAIGSTRFMDIQPAHRKLEIGWTFVAPEYWRTYVNTACKVLLMTYAFEQWNAVRVQFKAEAINARSRRAIERLGATYEGTLRNFGIRSDGDVRDKSFYSIIASEWPPIKQRLLTSLARQEAVGPNPR